MVAKKQDKKVLLAVDGFNGCFSPTSLKINTTEWVRIISWVAWTLRAVSPTYEFPLAGLSLSSLPPIEH